METPFAKLTTSQTRVDFDAYFIASKSCRVFGWVYFANTTFKESIMAQNDNPNKSKATLTPTARKRLVKAICLEYHEKLDSKAPIAKRDLNYTQIKEIMFLKDETKLKFKQLAFDEKIDPKDSLDKWRADVIAEFKSDFKFNANEEDIEDIQDELTGMYHTWFKENFPTSKKKISSATIRVSDFLTYMGTHKKDKTLPNLIQHGVNDLTTWKIKNLKMGALKSCREYLSSKSA